MSDSFSIGNKEFKVRKINAIKQFHIVRRMAPILSSMLPAVKAIAKANKNVENLPQEEQFDRIAEFVGPIMNGLSELSDADADKVLYGLLSAVEIKQELGNWAKISDGNVLMFDQLELPVLLQAAGRAFMHNMAGFFNELQRSS